MEMWTADKKSPKCKRTLRLLISINTYLRYQIVRFDHVFSNGVNIFIRHKMVQIYFVGPDGRVFICGSGFLVLGDILLIYLLGKNLQIGS